MLESGESVFTVTFNTKVDDAHIKKVLSEAGAKPDNKKIAKAVITGNEKTMSCYLTDSLNQLGRSLVIDLDAPHGMNFRQVDHRSISALIHKNVKYVLK